MATKVQRRRASETNKQLAIEAIRKLPDDATFEQIAEEVAILHSLQKAVEDIEAGRFITHEEFKRQIKQWFSK
jgi:predicted transcriptional regulator